MSREHVIAIDPARPLSEQPETGHNRWHEAIAPVVEVEPGDTVTYETRDAFDGQLHPGSGVAEVGALQLGPVHPLTGPVYVKGAEPGDLLEAELLSIEADPWDQWGYTAEVPGFGFLRDDFPDPYLVHWTLRGNEYAESEQLPGVRMPCSPFLGTFGLAPSARAAPGGHRARGRAGRARRDGPAARRGRRRPGRRADRERSAAHDRAARDGRQHRHPPTTPGVSLLLPVYAEGALVSTGDVHYAQGDCEACGTAIEIRSRATLRFGLRKGEAARRGLRDLQFFRDDFFAPARVRGAAALLRHHRDLRDPGRRERERGPSLAARNALLNMIEFLGTRGLDPQQAYALCSCAVDLRISQVVDVPNFLVTALLPLDIFV